MGYVASTSDELCVLSDIRFFSLTTRSWVPPREHNTPSIPLNGSLNSTITLVGPNQDPSDPNATRSLLPRARYAHLSSILTDQLFVIGGQDMSNVWLDDIHVYDLTRGRWILRRDFPRHCGTYRSVAVSAALRVRSPMEETQPRSPGTLTQSKVDGEHSLNGPSAMMGPPGRRFQIDASQPSSPKQAPSSDITHLPYSTNPTSEFPNDIYLYSNYNVSRLDLS